MPRQQQTYADQELVPLYMPNGATGPLKKLVNLAPSTQFERGMAIGKITSTANDLQTLTVTGTPTGGTIRLTGTAPTTGQTWITDTIAYNAAAATVASKVQAALVAAGEAGATVTGGGGALPGTPVTLTFGGSLAGLPVPVATVYNNSLTGGTDPAAAVVHTTTGRTSNTYAPYANGNSDGSQTAVAILPFKCITDARGYIWFSDVVGSNDQGVAPRSVYAYFANVIFDYAELTGLDANGITDLNARLVGDESGKQMLVIA